VTRRAALVAVLCAAGFLVLAALVDHGSLTRVDQWCVANLMPWLAREPAPRRGFTRFVLPASKDTLGGTLVELWTYPAAVVPSLAAVAAAAEALRRRGAVRAAAAWLGAWAAANVVELIGKGVLVRPALFTHGRHVAPFDQSYPSGHALRALLLAAALAWTWRRGRLALAWALSVPAALVALGDHTPTDVAGGVLAGAAIAVAAASYARRSEPRWTTSPPTTVSSTGSPGSSSGSVSTGSSAKTVRSAR